MTVIINSDLSILDLNKIIYGFLKMYVDDSVQIRFDLPEISAQPIQPTISVFLHDIHEDLQLNSSESCSYNNGVLQPAKINISCNYLIMYWDKVAMENSPTVGPVNQSIIVMNQVLNALLNNRQLKEKPGAFTRVITPKNESKSIGNFWSSIDNRPRLLLHYSVTIPITLTAQNDVANTVDTLHIHIEKK